MAPAARARSPLLALSLLTLAPAAASPAVAFAAPVPAAGVEPEGQAEEAAASSAEEAPREPWRAARAARSPAWLDFGATHRTRYEHLWNQPRPGAAGDDMGLSLRTTIRGELRFSPVVIGAELGDSRIYLVDDNTPLNTTLTNPVELLRAYLGVDIPDLFVPGARAQLRAGRMTMDVGSRRFVARNRFRNTINTFTGVDLDWQGPGGDHLRVFVSLPVRRLPDAREDLAANRIEFDREQGSTLFWGLLYGSRPTAERIQIEAYLFGLHERDASERETRDRRHVTPGLRILRPKKPGALDLELEAAAQLGHARATSDPEDIRDLTHVAIFSHVVLAYTLDLPARPRLALVHDYASGDADPGDARSGRFDTLFGARRFEFGPTGLYGLLARANIHSPGARLELTPHRAVALMFAYRAALLAQARDAWTTTGLRDESGAAGRFVGNQLEARARLQLLPGNVLLELGLAHTFLGEFPPAAAGAELADPTYLYAQLALEI